MRRALTTAHLQEWSTHGILPHACRAHLYSSRAPPVTDLRQLYGMQMGTIAWAAPELLRNFRIGIEQHRAVTHKADVFRCVQSVCTPCCVFSIVQLGMPIMTLPSACL